VTAQRLQPAPAPSASTTPSWNPRSVALIVVVWLVLHIGCLFTPGLLDDVDSIYIEIAREMLVRHDFVTPYVDGIRFFDKPPLLYWLAAGSMRVFGAYDWAARLPLALLTLGLLIATYALGLRLFSHAKEHGPPGSGGAAVPPDRAALYAALVLATCIGPFLYTRFFIPDILVCLWMTLAVHAFLVALDRTGPGAEGERAAGSSALVPCLAFAAVTALNLLTKGFIGLVFPIGFVVLYLAFTRQLRMLPRFHVIPSALLFLAIAAPWHILAAVRNPAIDLPPGLGLPARGGWAWFYLYNEHIARFLQRRIPHDYGQVPVWLFWLLAALWLFPWTAFLPTAIMRHIRALRGRQYFGVCYTKAAPAELKGQARDSGVDTIRAARHTALTLLLWAGIVLLFFTFSARQEYYSLPALPALALMAGGLLARAECTSRGLEDPTANRSVLAWHLWLLAPLSSLVAAIALFFALTAPHTDPRTDIASLLVQGGAYNLSLGHIFDLTGKAMGLFRAPLLVVGLSMIVIGPVTYLMRRGGRTYAANLTVAAASVCLLLCVHEGLVRFYPTLGSKELAIAILNAQQQPNNKQQPVTGSRPPDLILIDGELTAGSTLLFYTRQPVHLVNGHINGPWYGSFWPDAPAIFEDDASLDRLWSGAQRVFLLTDQPGKRIGELSRFGAVYTLAAAGGKAILTNQP
jgi:4-amino-4-deoxy-L-arabinose transferase-like glycosyltransferase